MSKRTTPDPETPASKKGKAKLPNQIPWPVHDWFVSSFGVDTGVVILKALNEMSKDLDAAEVRKHLPYIFMPPDTIDDYDGDSTQEPDSQATQDVADSQPDTQESIASTAEDKKEPCECMLAGNQEVAMQCCYRPVDEEGGSGCAVGEEESQAQ